MKIDEIASERFGAGEVEQEAMTKCVLAVTQEPPLDEAIELMRGSRCGSLVAIGRTGVAGILTATDALSALTDLLRRDQPALVITRARDAVRPSRARGPHGAVAPPRALDRGS